MKQLRVLIVEDSSIQDAILSEYLEVVLLAAINTDIEVSHAKSMAETEAITKLNRDFDLVLLDLNLPDSFGSETLRIARSLFDCPIIVLTSMTIEASELRKIGANELIKKTDLNEKKLRENINKCLAGLLCSKIGQIESSISKINYFNRKAIASEHN